MYILVIQIMLANTCILITRREEREGERTKAIPEIFVTS